MTKKFFALILATALIIGTLTSATVLADEEPLEEQSTYVHRIFDDVSPDKWYITAVQFAYDTGLMTGTSSTHFSPNSPLTREQFAVIIHRMQASPSPRGTKWFSDVVEGKWYAKAVMWCGYEGVIKGYDDGRFGIGDNITRQQMAVMMYRYAQYIGKSVSGSASLSSYADAGSVANYAYPAMSWAVANGIITGKNNGTILDPKGSATRAECASIIKRFAQKYGLKLKGSHVTFGSYEQDNNTSNGKEAIDWQILDMKDGKALLLSKDALDCRYYIDTNTYSSETWDKSPLRSWLNSTFLNAAFNSTERNRIATATVTADKNPHYNTNSGNTTYDKLFILSVQEVNRYFNTDVERRCAPSAYAKAHGAYTYNNRTDDGRYSCEYWLRTMGYYGLPANVCTDGRVNDYGYSIDDGVTAVRPALWIDIKYL